MLNQLAPLPLRVLMRPSTVVAVPPTEPAAPSGRKRRLIGNSKVNPIGTQHQQCDMLNQHIIDIGRKVVALGAECDRHRRCGLVGIVEIVPSVGEIVDEAEPTIGTNVWRQRAQDLLSIVIAIERRVFEGDEDVG
jgi:hypothetical protein